MSDEQTVRLQVADGVATMTLARPAARNALNAAMCAALREACTVVAADERVRLVLLRAEGPVFCAGADRKERAGMDMDHIRSRRVAAFAAYHALQSLPMPLVAVVEGPAIGSGCELAATCDFVVATPAAVFSTPEAVLGTVGATQRLPRVLGKRLAKDLMFTGRRLGAAEAQVAGLVTRLVEPEALEAELARLCEAICNAPPASLALAKRCIDEGSELDPRGALATEILAIEENLHGGEWRARMASFGAGGAAPGGIRADE